MSYRKKLLRYGVLLFAIAATAGMILIFMLPGPKLTRCDLNLMQLHEAEQNWANVNDKPKDTVPTWDDLRDFLAPYTNRLGWPNGMPICPQGGTYVLSRIDKWPRCTIGGRGHDFGNEHR